MKKYVKNYIKAIKPPYTKHDIPHLIITFVIIVIICSLLLTNTITNRHTLASNSGVPPTKPQILVGTEHPLHIPFTHTEQGTVHMYWLPSTDPLGISGYRIYRNGTKIGETNTTSFEDNGVSGNITYTIEAYDPSGNTSTSMLHVNLPGNWTAHVSPSDSVLSGFVLNKTTNNPISHVTITLANGKTIHTTQNGYYYFIYPGNESQILLTLTANGYNTDTEQVSLKKGQSVAQTLYLTPQTGRENDQSMKQTLLKLFTNFGRR